MPERCAEPNIPVYSIRTTARAPSSPTQNAFGTYGIATEVTRKSDRYVGTIQRLRKSYSFPFLYDLQILMTGENAAGHVNVKNVR